MFTTGVARWSPHSTTSRLDTMAMPRFERDQLRLLTATLGLDFVCVGHLRERDAGAPVFHDVNVCPTVVGAWRGDMPAGDRGRWHVFDNCARLGLPPPGGRPVWRQVDGELLRLATGAGGARTSRPDTPARSGS